LIYLNFDVTAVSEAGPMNLGIFRAWLLLTAFGLISLAAAFPSTSQAHTLVAAGGLPLHGVMRVTTRLAAHDHFENVSWFTPWTTNARTGSVDCEHNACCASMPGCCAPSSLIASESATVLPGETHTPVIAYAEIADGVRPDPLKRPPRPLL
jgi:hypothetical protein